MQNHNIEDEEIESREETQARKLARALLKEIDFVPSEIRKLVHEDMFVDDEEDHETGAHSDTSAETLTYQLDHLEEDLAEALMAFLEQLGGDAKEAIDQFVKGPLCRVDLTKWKEALPILVDHSLQNKPTKHPLTIIKQSS